MWDALPLLNLGRLPKFAFRPLLSTNLKVVCFCKKLYNILSRVGFNCIYTQYFPELPAEAIPIRNGISVFFWQRRQAPNWCLVKQLLDQAIPEKVTIRMALDPGCKEHLPSEKDIERYNISINSTWMLRAEYYNLLRSCNIFIAPRFREGIGMSFLEAMALGMCVVSADEATANEYIANNVNGILYDAHAPKPVHLEQSGELGQKARLTMRQRREDWLKDIDRVMTFVLPS
jgi:hypothetical protein